MDERDFLFYLRGHTVACLMIKGIIHPDMHEKNFAVGSNVLVDFGAEVKRFEFPDELDTDKVRQLTEALFPPIESIMKSFEKLSWFRAGLLEVGGELASIILANASYNNFFSFPYCKACFETKDFDVSLITNPVTKVRLKEWSHIICKDFGLDKSRKIDYSMIPTMVSKIKGSNLYYIEQLTMISKILIESIKSGTNLMSTWITILHFANRSIEEGFVYTGYGLLRKVLHWCGHAWSPIVLYHAKIEKSLEKYSLRNDIKDFIEGCIRYSFMEFLWIVNDIDTFVA